MNYQCIKVKEDQEYDNQITEIILTPAPANTVTAKMMGEISDCIKKQQEMADKKMIIFSGEGKHFSYGASVQEHLPDFVGNMLPKFHKFIEDILTCNIPTLAKVSGCCLGGGFELALACNFIFADEEAKLGVPEIELGVFPPPASVLLPLRCGDSFASEIILTGKMFKAPQVFLKGAVNTVSKPGKLDEKINNFIEKHILPKSASSLKIACKAAKMVTVDLYRQHIGKLEELYLKNLMSTKDAVEGITAFTEKRKAKWMNC